MGNDGGSIPDRRDLVRNKPKAESADKANQTRARWFFCALSKKRLQEPVVSCPLGKLYNKDAIIEFLLDRTSYGDGEEICGHIRSLKDVKTLKLTHNPASQSEPSSSTSTETANFICPLSLKEMNGVQPFIYISTCGCVFSQAGLRNMTRTKTTQDELEVCPQCATKFNPTSDVLLLNPSEEEAERMRAAMDEKRLAEPKKTKKRKKDITEEDQPAKKVKSSSSSPAPSMNPTITAASRSVLSSLAMEEAKRKAGMSDAIKSLYGHGKTTQPENFITRGTFNRYA